MNRFDHNELDAVAKVIQSGKLSEFFADFRGGPVVQAFEQEFKTYLGCKHAISVSNGTVSLEIGLTALGIGKGDEVITTPLSFAASSTSIVRVGAKPVFIDIDPETLNLDPYLIEDAITLKTKAIMPVPLLGMPCDMVTINKIAADHDLLVIEDAAQSLGAWWAEPKLKMGTFGHVGSFSFQATKTITSGGEGGMIVTSIDDIADKCRHIRNHGNVYGEMAEEVPCTNARMTEMQAAFGREQLKKLGRFIQTQWENARHLMTCISTPLRPVYQEADWPKSIYYLIPITLGKNAITRDQFIAKTRQAGISQGVPGQNIGYYKKVLYEYPILNKYLKKRCINAEWARDHVMLFDVHRWNKTLEDMENYAKIFDKLLATA
jgi:perosamine synthetase